MFRSSSSSSSRFVSITTTILIVVVVCILTRTTTQFGVVEAVPVANEETESLSSLVSSSSSSSDYTTSSNKNDVTTTTSSSMWDVVDQFNESSLNDDDENNSDNSTTTAMTTVSFNTMDEDMDNYYYDPVYANDQRQLHLLSSCPLFRVFFLFTAECECHYPLLDYPLLRGKIDIDCSRFVCSPFGTVCASVNFTTGFRLWPPAIDTGICIDKVSLFSDNSSPKGPFCLGLITRRLRNDCPKGVINCLQSGRAAKIKKPSNEVIGCNIKIDNEQCTSCTTCDKKGSVTFDCSNIIDGLKSSTCAKFPIWLGFGTRTNGILPRVVLDKD